MPIGYAAFAFALGVLMGLLIRRTIPAMAVTLAVIAVVLIAMPLGIRPHLISPVRHTTALTPAAIQGIHGTEREPAAGVRGSTPTPPGAWVMSTRSPPRPGPPTSAPCRPPAQPVVQDSGPGLPARWPSKNLKR